MYVMLLHLHMQFLDRSKMTIEYIDSSNATYSIPYNETDLKYIMAEMTGNLDDTIFEFGFDTVRIKQTNNWIKRWWGNMWSDLVGFGLKQNSKYGDFYMVIDEEHVNQKFVELREIIDRGEYFEN